MRSLMREASVTLALTVFTGCGTPTVELPPGSTQTTSDGGAVVLSPPALQSVPERYPFAKLALRGTATSAARIVVEGVGNPVAATVQPLDGSFCVDVALLTSPAHYTITVRSQGGDGRLSEPRTIEVERTKDAAPPKAMQLCDGSPADS